MMGGAALVHVPSACALCAAPLGAGDSRQLCGGCRKSAERALRRADPQVAAELRRHYGLEDSGK